jgi:hypothetical protein
MKNLKNIFVFIILIITGIFAFSGAFSRLENVSAEIGDKEFVNLVLTGGQGYYPYSYFDNLEQATHTNDPIYYYNKQGKITNTYRAITDKINSHLSLKNSTGEVSVHLLGGMKQLTGTGRYFVYASAGLLALKDDTSSYIVISLTAGGKTVSASSSLVYSGGTYSPDWVKTEKIYIDNPNEIIKFSFTNRGASSIWDPADFLIFEPTISFGLEVDEIITVMNDSVVAPGQLIELKAENFLSSIESKGDLINYYKNYHKIEWEILEGNNLASISGSYLNVTGNAGTIKVRAKCRASTENENYIYSKTISFQIDNSLHSLNLKTNFPEGANLFGGVNYSINEIDTVIFTQVKEGYTFLKYVDELGNDVPFTRSSNGYYRSIIDLDRSRAITAILIKNIKIDQIVVEDKYYDKNDTATIKEVVINGILPEHNIDIQSSLSAKFASVLPGENVYVILSGGVVLEGSDLYMYNFDSTIPETYAKILKRDIFVSANYAEKEYGMDDGSLTYSYTGNILPGDSLSGKLTREQGEGLGEYQILQGTLDNPNYNIIFTSNTFKITKRKLNITNVVIQNKTYDKTTAVSLENINLTMTGALSNQKATLKYVASYEDFNVGVNLLVNFQVWLEGEEKDNYELTISYPEIRADILPRKITIKADAKQKIYGENDPELTYRFNINDLLPGDTITGNLSRSSGEEAGTYRINIGTLEILNYDINYIGEDFIINKRLLKIEADEKGKIYGDLDPALTYKIIEGELKPNDNFGFILKRENGENIGIYKIIIDSQMNLNYEVEFVSANFIISKRDLTIKIGTQEKDYDGKIAGVLSIEMPNKVAGDNIIVNLETRFDSVGVGNKTVKYYYNGNLINTFDISIISGQSISNYNISFEIDFNSKINRKEVIVTLDKTTITKVYGEPDAEIRFFAEGVAEGESLIGLLTRTSGENVGSYSINQGTLTNENNPNYIIVFESDDFFKIVKRDIKLIVDNKEIIYGENEGEIVYYLSDLTPLPAGVTLNDLISGKPTRESGKTYGTYNYLLGSLILKQAVRNNYNLIFDGGDLTINKRPIEIFINDISKTYGEGDPILNYQIVFGMLVNANDLKFERELGENVGTYKINAVLNDSYELVSNEAKLTINPVQLIIKANNLLKTYGNEDPRLTYVITSGILMFDDTFNTVFTGSLERISGENAGTYIINQGTLTANSNYIISFQQGSLIIQKREITVTANPIRMFLDETVIPELTYTINGLVNGDTLNGELKVEGLNGLGDYDILIGTLNAQNYNINFVSAKFSIVKRSLIIDIDYVSKEYDGKGNATLTYSVSGDIAEGDEDHLGITLSKENGINVGRYLISATATNEKYNVIVNPNYFEILPRKITIKANNIVITYGDPIPDASLWSYTIEGQIIGNEIGITLYRTQNYGAGEFEILGTVTNTNNYDVTFIPGRLIINKKTVHITVSNYQKIYSQSDPIFEYEIEEGGLYNGDILQGTITRENGENVGEYNLICSLVNDNYNIVMNQAKLTILKKELVIVTSALDKIYDGTDVAYLRSPVLSGIVEGDDVLFEYNINSLAKFENAEVGDNKKVIVYGGELIGEDAQNYYLTKPTNLSANITNSVIEDEKGSVAIIAPKTNTKLKVGTTLQTVELATEQSFGESKSVVNSYSMNLLYNNESLENHGTITVKIDLGDKKYFNVQLFQVKNDGSLELVKSKYEDGSVVFDTDTLGTYIVIADNDSWLDYTLIGIAGCFVTLISIILIKNKTKLKRKPKEN